MLKNPKRSTLFYISFFIANLFLATFYIDLWRNDNTTSRVLPLAAYLEQGNFQIDKYEHLTGDKSYVAPHYYTDKAPLPIIISLPFAVLLKRLGIIVATNGSYYTPSLYAIGGFICGSVVFALIILITFKMLVKNKRAPSCPAHPVLWATLPFYSSFLFVYSGTFFGHLFAGGLLLASYVFIEKRSYFLSGLFIGLSFLSDYPIALIGLIWGLQIVIQKQWKGAFNFALGVLPSIGFILFYNYYFTGNAFTMLYKFVSQDYAFMKEGYGFALPKPEALWGLLISPYRGVLFYAPILLLFAFLAFKWITKETIHSLKTNYLLLSSILFVLFISSYQMWWGGWCWGPRHLTTITVVWLYAGIKAFHQRKKSIWIAYGLLVIGFIINFLAKSTIAYSAPSDIKFPLLETVMPNLLNGNFNPNNLASLVLGTSPLLASMLFVLLFVVLHAGFSVYYRLIQKESMRG